MLALELGKRRRTDGIDAVFASDLERAVETARIAFEDLPTPIFLDWRLRECNYGEMNGQPAVTVHGERRRYLEQPYPGGESWRRAIYRVRCFLRDLSLLRLHARVLVIGHVATRWALEHYLNGIALEDLVEHEFVWQAGWEYRIEFTNSLTEHNE